METPRNSDNYDISIHALRKESDVWPDYRGEDYPDFNPRSP